MTPKTLVLFFASLIGCTWLLELGAIVATDSLESPAAAPWLITAMFLPTVWSLAYLRRRRERWRQVSWRLGRPLHLLVAPLVPALMTLVALAILVTAGWARSPQFDFGSAAPEILRGPYLLGHGVQSWPWFLLNVAATATLFGLINGIPALGEEFGWRGLLQRQLIDRFGLSRGVVLLGLFWAAWHLPAILAGYNFPESPILGGFVLFPLQLVSASFILAWLTLRAGSFWPAALFHGSINGIYDGVTGLSLVTSVPRLQVDLVLVAIEGTLGALCWWSLVRRPSALAQRLPAAAGERNRERFESPAPSLAMSEPTLGAEEAAMPLEFTTDPLILLRRHGTPPALQAAESRQGQRARRSSTRYSSK